MKNNVPSFQPPKTAETHPNFFQKDLNLNNRALRERIEESVRMAVVFKLSPRAILGTKQCAALLTTALASFDEYNAEIQALEMDPAAAWAWSGDPRKFTELSKHEQNKIKDLTAAAMKTQKRQTQEVGKILRDHVNVIEKSDEDRLDELAALEEKAYDQNPELAAVLASAPEFSEFKVAADLMAFTERNAGIVEVAEYVRKFIINLGLEIFNKRYGKN